MVLIKSYFIKYIFLTFITKVVTVQQEDKNILLDYIYVGGHRTAGLIVGSGNFLADSIL